MIKNPFFILKGNLKDFNTRESLQATPIRWLGQKDGSRKEGASKKVTELSRSASWANKKMNQIRQD